MDELKQAFEKLGLPETATREEVEKRYDTLLRKYRANQRSGQEREGDFELINKAYRLILANEERQAAEQFNKEAYGKYKGMAGTAEKVDHFWRYYKFHVLGGLVVIAFLIYGINAYLDHRAEQERLAKLPPVDVSIMLLGNYFTSDMSGDTTPVEDKLLAGFPEWKRFAVSLNYLPLETTDQMDVASQQKAVVLLATERPDVYVMDKAAFEWLGPQEALLPLDDMAAGPWKELLKPGAAMKMATKENPAEHVYAIDVTGTKLASELPLVSKTNPTEYVIGIRSNTENVEKAKQFIEKFLASGN